MSTESDEVKDGNDHESLNISGIVVATRAQDLDELAVGLAALPGIDIFQLDRQSARIVITQDCDSDAEQSEGLRRIQAHPKVLFAELVHHYVGTAE